MKLLDVRIEAGLKEVIEELAERSGSTMSEIVRDLVKLGISIRNEGETEIVGPLGFRRPLAELSFPGGEERLNVRIDGQLLEDLREAFGENPRKSMRRALREGVSIIRPDRVRIRGPCLGIERPLAEAKSPRISNKRAKEALKRLQSIIECKKNF